VAALGRLRRGGKLTRRGTTNCKLRKLKLIISMPNTSGTYALMQLASKAAVRTPMPRRGHVHVAVSGHKLKRMHAHIYCIMSVNIGAGRASMRFFFGKSFL
jgi:hypothetical protein